MTQTESDTIEAAGSLPKTIYVGTFVHSLSLSNLEIGEKGAIGVDENGTIRFVERDTELGDVHQNHSEWKDAKVVELKGDGFYFPGFIGEFCNSNPQRT